VMGHGSCGGVAAALSRRFEGAPIGKGGFIAHWIDVLDDARDRIIAEHGEGEAAVHALADAGKSAQVGKADFHAFKFEREAAGQLRLLGSYFALNDGVLHLLDEASGRFNPA
jgi:carbonic anhydrase